MIYTCWGERSLGCGRVHRTPLAAMRCAERHDQLLLLAGLQGAPVLLSDRRVRVIRTKAEAEGHAPGHPWVEVPW